MRTLLALLLLPAYYTFLAAFIDVCKTMTKRPSQHGVAGRTNGGQGRAILRVVVVRRSGPTVLYCSGVSGYDVGHTPASKLPYLAKPIRASCAMEQSLLLILYTPQRSSDAAAVHPSSHCQRLCRDSQKG